MNSARGKRFIKLFKETPTSDCLVFRCSNQLIIEEVQREETGSNLKTKWKKHHSLLHQSELNSNTVFSSGHPLDKLPRRRQPKVWKPSPMKNDGGSWVWLRSRNDVLFYGRGNQLVFCQSRGKTQNYRFQLKLKEKRDQQNIIKKF